MACAEKLTNNVCQTKEYMKNLEPVGSARLRVTGQCSQFLNESLSPGPTLGFSQTQSNRL